MWSNFENSPLEDETISNTFSSRGMFKIRSEQIVEYYPCVQACVQNKQMVISIDKSMVLVEEDMETKFSFLSFNSNIDAFAISQTGNLIVCGLSNGEIHGIYIKGVPLFNVCIRVEDTPATGKCFAAIQEIDKLFYLSCSKGSIYRLCEIDENSLVKLSVTINENEVVAGDETLFDYVAVERLSNVHGLNNIETAILLLTKASDLDLVGDSNNETSRFQLIAGSNRKVSLLELGDNSATHLTVPDSYGGIKQIYNLDNYILLLTHSGHLIEVCPITKMIFFNSTSTPNKILIDELIIMESSDENIELLILTKEEKDSSNDTDCMRLMKFIQYPSMKCINEFEVPTHSWIVQQPKCAVNLYYLRAQDFNVNQLPTEVEMMSVSETEPSERFKKLIAKGHLEEAENYGRHFELCLQPIYEAKAKQILIQLCNLDDNNPELLNERFNELKKFMELIENHEFYYNNRMINLPSRKITQRFLSDVLKRLDKEHDETHIVEILEQLRRLGTLSIIDPYDCDSEWQKFVYNGNLVKYLTARLKNDIPIACLIWKRHSSAIVPHLNEKDLQKLLTLIPNNTEPFHLIQWLRQYVPIVSNIHPETMPFITDWGIQKTSALQYSDHWPDIGLEFSTKILEIIEEIEFMHFDVRRQLDQNIAKLRQLVNALQDLSVLKKSYNLTFTLDNYQQESLDETAFCILQRTHLAHVKNIVNDFLYPIFHEQGKSPITAIKRYINLIVACRNTLSTWLERAVACIELLHDEDDRLECALIVLQCCPVPWPETVAPLVKLRFTTHPLALKINSEFEIQVIKIMKVKYGWPADSVTDINLNLFMMRIVKMDLPDMLDDIRVLTKAAPEISMSANFNCCYQLVRRGKCELAFEFFKSLNTKKQKQHSKYADEVFELFADLLENIEMYSDEAFMEEQTLLIEFFKLIAPKDCESSQQRLHDIENRFILFKRFNQNTNSTSELASYHNPLELLNLGIKQIISRIRICRDSNQNISKYIFSEVCELTDALQVNKIQGIRIICKNLKCLHLTCSLAYAVLESDDCNPSNSEDFVDLALDIISQQILEDRSMQNILTTSTLSFDSDPLAFALAFDLLVRASFHLRNQLNELTELIQYVNISNISYPLNAIHSYYGSHADEINEIILKNLNESEALTTKDDSNSGSNNLMQLDIKTAKKRHSVSIFDDIDVQPTKKAALTSDEIPILKFVARTLLVIVFKVEPTNCFFLKLRNILLDEDKDINAANANKSFFASLEQLVKMKVHDVWYTMAQFLLDYQDRHDCNIIARDFVSFQLNRVFRHLMSQSDCNFIHLIAMAIADNHTDILFERLEQDLKTDQQKYNFLTLLQMYNDLLGEKDQVEIIRTKRLKHFYYMEFCKQDPSIKGKFSIEFDSIDKLLKEFRNKQLDVHLLERISRDFDLDLEYMLTLQVVSILESQEMQYEIKTDTFGEEELVMLTTVEQIRSLCQPYTDRIKCTETLKCKLEQLIEEINIYFYELYLCVIEILSFIDAVPKEMQIWKSILHFLKHKLIRRRRSRPGQLETDIWLQTQPDIGLLPKISRFRLPFKPIVEHPLKDTLDHELSVDNCESWFPLIDLHIMLKDSKEGGNMRDYFCMAAVKNCITEYKAKHDTEIWHIQPTNNAFLKSILRLVMHIENPSKKFLLLYFVSNYAPEGADQVEATYECYKYARENEKLISDPKCQEQLLKIMRKYPKLKTQHLLYVYGLTDEKLLHLVENPKELIYNLYHHELILKPCKLDINTVIKEIAQLHEINLEETQFHLLQKWLAFSQDVIDGTILEDTFFEDQHMTPQNIENVDNAGENVLRANSILSTWPKKQAVEFLIAHIFPVDGVPNTSKQLQMLECLSKLNDGSASLQNVLSQRKYISIKCVHDLKQLGYNSSVSKFENCNKIDILKKIWQHNAQNPHALEILANICLGYDIYLERIWNGILKRMVMFNMVRQLNALVEILSCQPHLLDIDGLVHAWEYVLKHPFKNSNKTRSFEQEQVLLKNLFRLQSCPVLEKLNLLDFAIQCTNLDRPHMAAVLVAFTKCDEEREKIMQLVATRRSEKLRKDILELEDAGILPTAIKYSLKELQL